MCAQVLIDWFNQRLEDTRAQEPGTENWSVDRVLAVVASSAQFWRGADKLKSFQELRCTCAGDRVRGWWGKWQKE